MSVIPLILTLKSNADKQKINAERVSGNIDGSENKGKCVGRIVITSNPPITHVLIIPVHCTDNNTYTLDVSNYKADIMKVGTNTFEFKTKHAPTLHLNYTLEIYFQDWNKIIWKRAADGELHKLTMREKREYDKLYRSKRTKILKYYEDTQNGEHRYYVCQNIMHNRRYELG